MPTAKKKVIVISEVEMKPLVERMERGSVIDVSRSEVLQLPREFPGKLRSTIRP